MDKISWLSWEVPKGVFVLTHYSTHCVLVPQQIYLIQFNFVYSLILFCSEDLPLSPSVMILLYISTVDFLWYVVCFKAQFYNPVPLYICI